MRRALAIACLVCAFILSGALNGCSYYESKQLQGGGRSANQYKTSELTFNSVYNRVFRSSCAGCHGSSGGVDLKTYAGVRSNLSKIYQEVFVTQDMPKEPISALSADQFNLLRAWISAGAPESAAGGEEQNTLEPNWASIRANILEPKCLMCHKTGGDAARVPLGEKSDLLNSPLEIVLPGNPEESGLILSVTSNRPDKLMPPLKDKDGTKTGFSKLSDAEVSVLSTWIGRGAKD